MPNYQERTAMPNAVVMTGYGPPEVLTWAALPLPEPGQGQIRIKVRAAGISPTDLALRAGYLVGRPPAREHNRRGPDPARRRRSRDGRDLSSGRPRKGVIAGRFARPRAPRASAAAGGWAADDGTGRSSSDDRPGSRRRGSYLANPLTASSCMRSWAPWTMASTSSSTVRGAAVTPSLGLGGAQARRGCARGLGTRAGRGSARGSGPGARWR